MYAITGFLGLALIAAPFAIGYAGSAEALWTSVLIGGVIVAVSFLEWIEQYDTWEYWVAASAGLLSVVAPFAFGFSDNVAATRFIISVGLLLSLLSGVVLYYDKTHHGLIE